MHGPSPSARSFLLGLIVALASPIGLARPAPAGTSEAVAEARRRLARDDGPAAVAILEDALADSGPSKDAVLGLLRRAYDLAANQAEAAGRPRDAETYRENLRILARKPRAIPVEPPASPPPSAPDPPPGPVAPPISFSPPVEAPAVAAAAAAEVQPEPASGATPSPIDPPAREPAAATPSPRPKPPAEAPAVDAATADAAFEAKDYAGAGRIYAALAREDRLPANRRDPWAYCRSVEVARRINARPQTEAEWASIDAEIDRIRALNPKNWLGEYLRNHAAERLASRKKARPGKAVVRASSPEEPPARERPARAASNVAPPAAAAPANAPAPARPAGGYVGRWQIRDTANFRIYHADPALAEKVAGVAETIRRDQTRRWTNQPPAVPWQPRCEVYLYPSAKQYAAETGQPEDSPGFSTMGMNEGRIISRRVNLKADHETLVPAVLPHEITHVILADSFTVRQIPRWADEGMAVLSEPDQEQDRRAVDLVEPLGKNMLFPIETLMNMDYPDNRYWGLYYAQSVSLTRFLVERGSPAQLVQFLQGAQRNGFEPELKRVYQIDGFADLQARWVAYARSSAAAKTAAAAVSPDLRVR